MAIDQKKAFAKMFDQVRENWGEKYGVEIIDAAREELRENAEAAQYAAFGDIGEYFGMLSATAEELHTAQKKVVPLEQVRQQRATQQQRQEAGFHFQVRG